MESPATHGAQPCYGVCIETVEEMIRSGKDVFRKDNRGYGPIHVAARQGVVDIVDQFYRLYPESIKELTVMKETALHVAVMYDQLQTAEYLIRSIIERPGFSYLCSLGNYDGNTVLHLSTSRLQLKTIKLLLSAKLVDVNQRNNGGFTALDILHVLPYSGKIIKEIDTILRQAGAKRSQYLVDGCHESKFCNGHCRFSIDNKINGSENAMLLAFLLTTVTFQVGIISTSRLGNAASNLANLVIVFNFVAFSTSTVMTISLLKGFRLTLWPQISLLCMFCSYIFLIMAVSYHEAKVFARSWF